MQIPRLNTRDYDLIKTIPGDFTIRGSGCHTLKSLGID